jgi:DNA-binding NtrC family response regulator
VLSAKGEHDYENIYSVKILNSLTRKGSIAVSKILVVDDEDSIRKLLKRFLSSIGHEAILASNGEEALEKLQEKPVIVLLDFKMPGENGIEVLEKIKEISPSIEVIMVTGVGGHEIGMESFKQGAFEFVTKPIDLSRLKFLLDFRLGQMGLA